MEKYSKQKEELYKIIKTTNTPLTAEEIYLKLNEKKSSVSRGTVYRNLNILVEKGVVKQIAIPNHPDRFEFIRELNNYAVCKKCGKVFDFQYSFDNESLKKAILGKTDLEIFSSEFTIYGICSSCNKNK